MDTKLKIIILIVVNFGVSVLIHILDLSDFLGLPTLIFGALLSYFYLYHNSKDWWKLVLHSILFFILFWISSFGSLAISRLLFQTDAFLPFFSTPFSILAILIMLKRSFRIGDLLLTGLVAVILGIFATYLTMSEWGVHPTSKLGLIVFDVYFIWQTAIGISLIIGLDKVSKSKHATIL